MAAKPSPQSFKDKAVILIPQQVTGTN